MNSHNNWRRVGGVVMVATLALFAGACSKDNESKSTTTTTVKGDKTDKATPSSTAKPLSDEEYSAKVAEISTAITGAGTDLCKLSTVTTEGPPEPTNPKQTEAAVGLYVELLNAVAGAFPAESAASSEALRNAATTLQTEAAAAGYPPDFLSGDAGKKALSGEGYTAAMTEYQSIYQAQCAPAAPTDPAANPTASTVPKG